VEVILLLVVEALRLGLSLSCLSYICPDCHMQLYLRWNWASIARLRSRVQVL
jgi:hypothetical protein